MFGALKRYTKSAGCTKVDLIYLMEDSEVMRQKKIHYIYNKEMECMDPEERRKLQGERLRKTVELEYANVPAYRARMDEAGVKPEDINSIDDIVKLPFMQKTDLRDNFPFGLFAAESRVHQERQENLLYQVTPKTI